MKILLVIDNLGSGGAQRQITLLANELIKKNHLVDIFTYYSSNNFFKKELNSRINHLSINKDKKGFSLRVISVLKSLIKNNHYDIALSFLDTPSIYLILATKFSNNKTPIICSDRNYYLNNNSIIAKANKLLFHLANKITTNSYSQAKWLNEYLRIPQRKIVTIYNGYYSNNIPFMPLYPDESNKLTIIGIGRITKAKNIKLLADSLIIFIRNKGWVPTVHWYGRINNNEQKSEIDKLLSTNYLLKSNWFWHDETHDVWKGQKNSNILILPSFYEGLPNVVCEAMLAGKMILASNVCDNPRLLDYGKRGFLFSPYSPEELEKCITKVLQIDKTTWDKMVSKNREYAVKELSVSRLAKDYETLFKQVIDKNDRQ